jgi:hypothetical protein
MNQYGTSSPVLNKIKSRQMNDSCGEGSVKLKFAENT